MIIRRYLKGLFSQADGIDTILLACTHYPILYANFARNVPPGTAVLEQGPVIARKLKDYLFRHPEMETRLSRKGQRAFQTTDTSEKFDRLANVFYGEPVHSELVSLDTICS
jgi:glutamate racemase